MADAFLGTIGINFNNTQEWVLGTDYNFIPGAYSQLITWKGLTYVQISPNSDPNAEPQTLPTVWSLISPNVDISKGIKFDNNNQIYLSVNTNQFAFTAEDGDLTLVEQQPVFIFNANSLVGENAQLANLIYTDTADNTFSFRCINVPQTNIDFPCNLASLEFNAIEYTNSQTIQAYISIYYFSTAVVTSVQPLSFSIKLYSYNSTTQTASLIVDAPFNTQVLVREMAQEQFVTDPVVIGNDISDFILQISNIKFPIANGLGISKITVLPIIKNS